MPSASELGTTRGRRVPSSGRLQIHAAQDFRSITGEGVVGQVDGRRVAFGNARLLAREKIDQGDLAQRADALRAEGQTVMWLALDGRAAGLIGVADPIKATTEAALAELRADGARSRRRPARPQPADRRDRTMSRSSSARSWWASAASLRPAMRSALPRFC